VGVTLLHQARNKISQVSQSLIDSWKAANPTVVELTATATSKAPAADEAPELMEATAAVTATRDTSSVQDQQTKAPAAAPGKRAAGVGVSPGSFLGLLLQARHRGTGEQLSDKVVMAQSNTFILAGYETTANTLAFSIYNIARYPEVQERLLEEVDAFGRGRPVSAQHMDQVRGWDGGGGGACV
jgi:cytochrome P450